jgi:hypothetical protein
MSFSKFEIEKLMKAAQTNFINFGRLEPALIFKINGEIVVKSLCGHAEDKDEQVRFICNLIEQNKIEDYIMVVEGWAAPKNKEADELLKQNKSLEQCLNRKEIILLQHCSYKTDSMHMCEITRTEDYFSFSEWQTNTQPASIFSGTFQSLFLKNSARNN